jgi:malonyl CoA-acyl carrier protein transacylase
VKVIAFAGQGSLRRGAGVELFDKYRDLLAHVRAVLGYSIEELILHDEGHRLTETDFAQPAIFVLNHLYYLEHLSRGEPTDVAIGHSLGEYNALVSAGVFSFEVGLRMVQMRGILMVEVRGGAMCAVVDSSVHEINEAIERAGLSDVEVGNFNSPRQHVISGMAADVEVLEKVLAQKARCFRLNVSGPFHSRFMKPAAAYFRIFLERFAFRPPAMRVYSNARASEYSESNVVDCLSDQIWMPVRWTEIIDKLISKGASFVELGHSNVLSNMRKDFVA